MNLPNDGYRWLDMYSNRGGEWYPWSTAPVVPPAILTQLCQMVQLQQQNCKFVIYLRRTNTTEFTPLSTVKKNVWMWTGPFQPTVCLSLVFLCLLSCCFQWKMRLKLKFEIRQNSTIICENRKFNCRQCESAGELITVKNKINSAIKVPKNLNLHGWRIQKC